MLTAFQEAESITGAVEAGAAGYLLKDASPDLLCHTAHAVNEGGTLLGKNLLRQTLASLKASGARMGDGAFQKASVGNLTHRESQVLKLIVDGMANKEIASTLVIAEDTVKKHVQSIIAKLGVSDRTQAAVKAVRQGLVD